MNFEEIEGVSLFLFRVLILNNLYRWPDLESNQGHEDFQSSALPTELSGLMWGYMRGKNDSRIKPIAGA
jgi:hypothetical protein